MNQESLPFASARGKLAHVSVIVTNLPAAERFYEEKLGLPRIARPNFKFPGAWYDLGGGLQLHVIVNDGIRRSDEEKATFEVRYAHFAIGVDDADAVAHLLRERGLEINELFSSPTGMRQVFVKDPDGNMVEFIGPGSASASAKTGSSPR